MNFIFTCGGTAGHVNPAIAVAEMLKKKIPESRFLFIGAEGMMEMDLVPKEGFDIRPIVITNISRGHSFSDVVHNLKTVFNTVRSIIAAKKIIKEFKPDAVIGTGGYVCFPVITAAHFLHIPTFVHESNAVPGLTTKLISSFVDRIYVGMKNSRDLYKRPDRVLFTGTPVRSGFGIYEKDSIRNELDIKANVPLVLSVWGSLGSEHMNRAVAEIAKILKPGHIKLIHVTGKQYYDDYKNLKGSRYPAVLSNDFELKDYLYDIPKMMVAADLILCRAGASTISELTYLGKPAIIVPSPNVVNNHQEKNARVLEKAGAAKVLLESEITPELLLEEIDRIIYDSEIQNRMTEAMLAAGVKESADIISADILSFIETNKRS